MTRRGMEVLSNSRCSSLKIIRTNHQLFASCHGCFILIFMQMGVYAWTFYKTSGVRYTMLLLYSPPSSRCSVTLIQILLRTRKRLGCTAKASASTTGECAMLSSRAGLPTSKQFRCKLCNTLSLSMSPIKQQQAFFVSFSFMSFCFLKTLSHVIYCFNNKHP